MTAAALTVVPETPLPTKAPAQRPDAAGRFGRFGGKYVPETLIAALSELEVAYREAQEDPEFQARSSALLSAQHGSIPVRPWCSHPDTSPCSSLHQAGLSVAATTHCLLIRTSAHDSCRIIALPAEGICRAVEGLCGAAVAAVPCRAAIRALQAVRTIRRIDDGTHQHLMCISRSAAAALPRGSHGAPHEYPCDCMTWKTGRKNWAAWRQPQRCVHTHRPDGTRAEIYLKREDLNHTGAHKINNSLGQVLLCRRMGKQRIIAETGAGQHGVATVSLQPDRTRRACHETPAQDEDAPHRVSF